MSLDFSREKYCELCDAIVRSSYHIITFKEFCQLPDLDLAEKNLIIRHDIDKNCGDALQFAQLEYDFGIRSSYYFRIPRTYNQEIIRAINNLNHEIGLHYECLDKSNGDIALAKEILKNDLAVLRQDSDVTTIAMHGGPTQFDNKEIWKYYSYREFGLLGEAYLSMNFEKFLYFSDTGRNWNNEKNKVKDAIPLNYKRIDSRQRVKTTDDLIDVIREGSINLYLLIHPERWPQTLSKYIYSYSRDKIVNIIKRAYPLYVTIKK